MLRHLSPRPIVLLCALALVATSCGGIEQLTTTEALDRLNIATTKVFAADGSLIANLHGEINRDIVPLGEIPRHVRNAVIAVEDERFWSHSGIDVRAITRAAVRNVSGSAGTEGGSTLSQQLVKNLYFPNRDRTVQRKLLEAEKTWRFEREYSKQQILEMYLNTIYFGRGVYGIETAARSYFHKDTEELTLAEAAYLAGLVHEPGRYDFRPDDPSERREERIRAGIDRRNVVLDKMTEFGFVDPEDAGQAKAADLDVFPRGESEWRYPYFVDMVLTHLGVFQDRCEKTGPDPRFDEVLGDTCKERAEKVYQGGLRIYTSLDPDAQEAAEEAVNDVLPTDIPKLFASLAAVEPGTGYVRALVGGRNYYPDGCEEGDGSLECEYAKLNLALGRAGGGSGRQPGSSFKPFVLAAALERGISLRSTYPSAPFTATFDGGPPWTVRNYEGSGGGSTDLVEGTVSSVNAVYAHLLIDGVGEGRALRGAARVADVARRMGVDLPTREDIRRACGSDYGSTGRCTPADDVPSVALGAKEVSPLSMAAGYATFANDGVRTDPVAIVRITDNDGNTLYEAESARTRVLPADIARGATAVLEQVVERGTGTAARLDRPAGGKTGTAQEWRDAWFAGFVPQLSAVVWVGNPEEQESMTPANGYPIRVTGGSYPAQIWKAFMDEALDGVPVERFAPPPRSLFVPTETPAPEAEIPDILGLFRDDAVAALVAAGFSVTEEHCLDPSLPEGTIVSQAPPGGAWASEGSAVVVCTSVTQLEAPATPVPEEAPSQEAEGAVVPHVVGSSLAAARSELSQAGFSSEGVRECDPTFTTEAGHVWQQSPPGGTRAEPGSTVTIWYNPAAC